MARVLIVGAGAAGCELAWGLVQQGVDTTLLTTSLDTVYALPADRWRAEPPAGSLWARIDSEARLTSGELAAGALRRAVKRELERQPALRLVQSNVTAIELDANGHRALGVRTWEGPVLEVDALVLAVGSFLGARLEMGALVETAGRLSEMAYDELYHDLLQHRVPMLARTLTLADEPGTPGYSVHYQAFAAAAMAPLHHGSARLLPFENVYAVGLVAGAEGISQAAEAGRALSARARELGWMIDAR